MSRFDDVLGAAQSAQNAQRKELKTEEKDVKTQPKAELDKAAFWDKLASPEKAAEIRLSVSIPRALNEKIEAKARQLRLTKNALINEVLAHMFDD